MRVTMSCVSLVGGLDWAKTEDRENSHSNGEAGAMRNDKGPHLLAARTPGSQPGYISHNDNIMDRIVKLLTFICKQL